MSLPEALAALEQVPGTPCPNAGGTFTGVCFCGEVWDGAHHKAPNPTALALRDALTVPHEALEPGYVTHCRDCCPQPPLGELCHDAYDPDGRCHGSGRLPLGALPSGAIAGIVAVVLIEHGYHTDFDYYEGWYFAAGNASGVSIGDYEQPTADEACFAAIVTWAKAQGAA